MMCQSKEYRLKQLSGYSTFTFIKENIADKELVTSVFEKYKPEIVVNLAAQAGVRYSITNPDAYVESNLVGFFFIFWRPVVIIRWSISFTLLHPLCMEVIKGALQHG